MVLAWPACSSLDRSERPQISGGPPACAPIYRDDRHVTLHLAAGLC